MEELSNKRLVGFKNVGSGLNHPPEAKTQIFLYGANQKSACQFISILNSKRSNNKIKAKKQVGPSKLVLVVILVAVILSSTFRLFSTKYFVGLHQFYCR
jgi:hypothetical protein